MQNTFITVSWIKNIYVNKTNGYTVALYKNEKPKDDEPNTITCTGEALPNMKDTVYRMDGAWDTNKKYGRQFVVTGFAEVLQTDENSVISYFSSGIIRGVGKVIAGRIYAQFGENVFHVMDTEPERLLEIRGISRNKYEIIMESYRNNRAVTQIYEDLKGISGITSRLCARIYKKYGHDAVNVINSNPYRLMEIRDVGFGMCDAVAAAKHFPRDSYERFCAASEHVLLQNEMNGDLGMDIQKFGYAVRKVLAEPSISNEQINAMTIRMLQEPKNKRVFYKCMKLESGTVKYMYRMVTYRAERQVAEDILRLASGKREPVIQFEDMVRKQQNSLGIQPDLMQEEAIKSCLEEPFSIITGGPGTGKTTVLLLIAKIFEKTHAHASILFMAPTGRAARRINESTGYMAQTIHSRLGLRDTESVAAGMDKDDECDPLDEDLIIVDECSMLDVFLAKKLFHAIADGRKVVLVGDINQLQSVGPGAVFRDIIQSEVVPVKRLSRIFRQDDGAIIENADRIQKNRTDLITDGSFEIHDRLYSDVLEDEMVRAYMDDVQKYGTENVACLCPVKDHAAGVNRMNARIQALLNPPSPFKAEMRNGANIIREGDLIMELRNGETTVNGDIGYVTKITGDKGAEVITCEYFGSEEVTYEEDEHDRITLAYAMTVHKAQGSEYMSVITCLQDQNYHMLKRNIPYTAFTRAKEVVRFFGSKKALDRAIENTDSDNRHTLLTQYLRYSAGKEVEYLD